jgi:hypothetical protein
MLNPHSERVRHGAEDEETAYRLQVRSFPLLWLLNSGVGLDDELLNCPRADFACSCTGSWCSRRLLEGTLSLLTLPSRPRRKSLFPPSFPTEDAYPYSRLTSPGAYRELSSVVPSWRSRTGGSRGFRGRLWRERRSWRVGLRFSGCVGAFPSVLMFCGILTLAFSTTALQNLPPLRCLPLSLHFPLLFLPLFRPLLRRFGDASDGHSRRPLLAGVGG